MIENNLSKKQILKFLIITVFVLFVLASLFSFPVFASEQYSFYLDGERDIEIAVLYQGPKPSVSIVSPNGDVYSNKSDFANIEEAEGIINYYIKSASEGNWTINSSGVIDYTVLKWNPALTVSSFGFEKGDNDSVRVFTVISSERNEYFNWDIYAVSDSSVAGQPIKILLGNSYGTTNSNSEVSLNTANLPDGNWSITMEAYIDYSDGTESDVYATASGKLSVSGHTQSGDNKDISVVADITDSTVEIDWSAVTENYSEMLVSVTDDAGECLMHETFSNGVKKTRVVTDDTKDHLNILVMPLNYGSFDTRYSIEVPMTPSEKVSIDTQSSTGDLMLNISYDVGDKTVPLEILLNGTKTAYQIKGTGSLSVPLESMENNELFVRYTVKNGLCYQISRTISVRSDPPFLALYGIPGTIVTNEDKVAIIGRTDPDASLSVNGSEFPVSDDGSFNVPVAVAIGENNVEIVAISPYGVRTVQTIVVKRTNNSAFAGLAEGKIGEYLSLIICLIIAVISTVSMALTALISKKKGKKVPVIILNMIHALLLLCAVGSGSMAGYCYYRYRRETTSIIGDKLIALLQASDFDRIAEGLDLRDAWKALMIKFIIQAVCCLAVFVLIFVIERAVRKKAPLMKKKDKEKKNGKNNLNNNT